MLSTIVFTSVNPFSRVDIQRTCFQAWKNMGFDIRTLNNTDEKRLLIELGFDERSIIELDAGETAEMFFGKQMPRIVALFEHAVQEFNGRQLVIVNSDIYPAARSKNFVEAYLEVAPAVALTREDVISLGSPPTSPRRPYRGGLDIFIFKPWAVKQMAEQLSVWPSSERMAFGIPGWDFLVGAQLINERVGGSILDGSLLLHVCHPTTYGNIEDEFRHYVPALHSLGLTQSESPAHAAADFAKIIDNSCRLKLAESRRVWACFYKPHPNSDLPSALATEIARSTTDLVPWISWNYSFAELARFADERIAAETPSLEKASEFFCRHPHRPQQFAELLVAFLFEIACSVTQSRELTRHYPPQNLHAKAVEQIVANLGHQHHEMRMELAKLFLAEIIDYRIFNVRLHDWLTLSCENDDERTLISEISKFWQEAQNGTS